MTSVLVLSAPQAVVRLGARLLDDVPKPEDVTPGWIYALVIVGLFAVTILLWLSMRKQLKKINVPGSSPRETPRDDEVPPAT